MEILGVIPITVIIFYGLRMLLGDRRYFGEEGYREKLRFEEELRKRAPQERANRREFNRQEKENTPIWYYIRRFVSWSLAISVAVFFFCILLALVTVKPM